MPAPDRLSAVLKHLEDQDARHVKELQEFVRIPSIGADPAYDQHVRRAARWLVQRLKRAGMESVRLVPTQGHPAVVAEWMHAGPEAPTVLVYGHYDVQPAAREDGWTREPFGGEVEGGRLWGRGASDDKGQMMCHVWAAEAWLAEGGAPVNLRMVFEGEEESGSVHFGEVLDAEGDRMRCDVVLVSDGPMKAPGHPSVTYALRGLVSLQVDVQGPSHDLHSGSWGGAVRNPAEALAGVLASCKDPRTGRVRVKGFYDGVKRPPRAERVRLAEEGASDDEVQRGAGVAELFGERGWSAQERIGLRPTFEVNGMWGGYTGEGAKTIVPASAHAKLSCRLVAGQDPDHVAGAVRRHLEAALPSGLRMEVRALNEGPAVRSDPQHPYVRAAARALDAAFGRRSVLLPEGGSIPAVAQMHTRLGVLPVLVGFTNRDENMHGPDEGFRLDSLRRGREACARMLSEIADSGRP